METRSRWNLRFTDKFSRIWRKKLNNVRNDRQQIRAKPTLGEVFVIFHVPFHLLFGVQGQLKSKAVSSPFHHKAPTQRWGVSHIWFPSFRGRTTFKQNTETCGVYLTSTTTSHRVGSRLRPSFINWNTSVTGLVGVLTHNCCCWLVSKPSPYCQWYLQQWVKEKKTSQVQFCPRAVFALRLTARRKCLV